MSRRPIQLRGQLGVATSGRESVGVRPEPAHSCDRKEQAPQRTEHISDHHAGLALTDAVSHPDSAGETSPRSAQT